MKPTFDSVVGSARPKQGMAKSVAAPRDDTPYSLLLVEAVASMDSCIISAAELDINSDIEITRESRIEAVIGLLTKQKFDAVIYDLSIENNTGLVNLDRIVGASPDIPVIVLCERSDDHRPENDPSRDAPPNRPVPGIEKGTDRAGKYIAEHRAGYRVMDIQPHAVRHERDKQDAADPDRADQHADEYAERG